MSNLISFFFENNIEIRCVRLSNKLFNKEYWFVAVDIATHLAYTNTNDAIINHCKYATTLNEMIEQGVISKGSKDDLDIRYLVSDARGRYQPATKLIPEGDLYELVLCCKKPEAQKFKDWVNQEILPSIRAFGSYSLNQNHTVEDKVNEIFNNPKELCKYLLVQVQKNLELETKVQELEAKIEEDAPDLAAFNKLVNQDGLISVDVFGHTIGIGRTTLFKYLRAIKWVQKTSDEDVIKNSIGYKYVPSGDKIYQSVRNSGLMETRLVNSTNPNSPKHWQVLLTKKGAANLYKKLLKESPEVLNKQFKITDFNRSVDLTFVIENSNPSDLNKTLLLNHMDSQSDSIN